MHLYPLIRLKERIEFLLMQPFVWVGSWQAMKRPLQDNFDLFCFFSSYGMGGAERVNADVLKSFANKNIIVFFTRKSPNNALLQAFQLPHVTIMDISADTDSKWRYWKNFIWRGRCMQYIIAQQRLPVVFNGQCNFGYKVLPHLPANLHTVEMIHVSDSSFARVTFPYIPYIKVRIASAATIMQQHLAYCKYLGVPEIYNEHWRVVTTQVEVPDTMPTKNWKPPLQVYYVGRGGWQKRVWLIAQIVRRCKANSWPVEFHLIGDLHNEIPDDVKQMVQLYGIITNPAQLAALHARMHVLLMTSAVEGFPLSIMEAMAQGSVPVVTAVNAIPEHVHDGENGFLLQNPDNEQAVVEQAVSIISKYAADVAQLQPLSANAYQYAQEHFSSSAFHEKMADALFSSTGQ